MKSLIAVFSIIVSQASALDFDALMQGAALLSSPAAEKGNLSDLQKTRQSMVLSYYQGFIGAATRSAVFANPGQQGKYRVQEWMLDEQRGADSISRFIGDHQTMGSEIASSQVDDLVMAWYLWNCRGADKLGKGMSITLLMGIFGRGFPGQETMVREVAEMPSPAPPHSPTN